MPTLSNRGMKERTRSRRVVSCVVAQKLVGARSTDTYGKMPMADRRIISSKRKSTFRDTRRLDTQKREAYGAPLATVKQLAEKDSTAEDSTTA